MYRHLPHTLSFFFRKISVNRQYWKCTKCTVQNTLSVQLTTLWVSLKMTFIIIVIEYEFDFFRLYTWIIPFFLYQDYVFPATVPVGWREYTAWGNIRFLWKDYVIFLFYILEIIILSLGKILRYYTGKFCKKKIFLKP